METNQKKRWEKKGKQEPFEAVLEQGRVQISLAETHAEPLAGRGWTGEKTATLSTRVVALDGRYSVRSSKTDAAREATKNKAASVSIAKAYIKTLRFAVIIVLRDYPTADITEKAFKVGERLGRSCLRISKYLMRVRPFVEALEAFLTPYFGGESPLSLLEAAKAGLESSGADQPEVAAQFNKAIIERASKPSPKPEEPPASPATEPSSTPRP